MAQQTLLDGTSGLAFRTICNENFTELYQPISLGKAGGGTLYGGSATTEGLVLQANATDTTTGTITMKGSGLVVATSITMQIGNLAGIIKTTAGVVSVATGGTDYIVGSGVDGGQTVLGGTATTQGLILQANATDATTGTVALKGSAVTIATSALVTLGNTTAATGTSTAAVVVAGGLGVGAGAYIAGTAVIQVLAVGSATTLTSGTNTGDECGLSGRPFFVTKAIEATAASTAIHFITDANVGAGKKAYVSNILLTVSGADAWVDGTATIVTIQDTEGTAGSIGATFAKAQLTGSAVLGMFSTGCTLSNIILQGTGFTTGKGLDIVGDNTFSTGSTIYCTLSGYIK